MIKLENLNKFYSLKNGLKYHALRSINLEFKKGEFVAIVGRSGSGKSTLLNLLGGFDKYDDGSFFINNINVNEFNDNDWNNYRNQKIGFVFQSFNLIPHLTILENVEFSLIISDMSKDERKKTAIDVLKRVGLEKHINKKPGYLSGGEQQRVAIARAIVNDPDIILADEPTGQLDKKNAIEIMNLIQEIGKDRLVIMVTHMEKLVSEYVTRVIKINDGTIKEDNIKSNIVNDYSDSINEIKLISIKNINYISLKNIRRRLISSITLFVMFSLIISLVLTSIVLGKKQVQSDIYYVFSPDEPMNMIRISKDNNNSFSENEISNLSNLVNVESVLPHFNEEINLKLKDLTYTFSIQIGLLPENENDFYLNRHLIYGRYPVDKMEVIITPNSAIKLIDQSLQGNLKSRYEQGLLSNTEIWEQIRNKNLIINNTLMDVKIVGMLDNQVWNYNNSNIFTTQQLAYDIYNTNEIYELNVFLKSVDKNSREETKTNIIRINEDYVLNNTIEKNVSDVYERYQPMNNFVKALLFITSIITIVSTFALINFNMYSRVKEVGILKSLGLSSRNIKGIFAFELLYISVFSYFLGYIFSIFFIKFFIKITKQIFSTSSVFVDYQTIIPDLSTFTIVLIFFTLFIYISSIIPIQRISKKQTVEILRY